ncbi:MAG: response regulator [Cypionkella sp.]
MKLKILAVDDEPLFLEILDVALTGLGYTDVSHAYSAKEALRELEVSLEKFDCILLDIRMPGMDGVELCRRIRMMDRYRGVPIMMVTSMSDRSYIDTAFAAGATDYLGKPLDATELKARMAMMERLVVERLRNQLLEYRVAAASNVVELKFDLETPVMVEGFDRLIEYLALENYLLSLGIKDSYDASAFVISISNAARIFGSTSPVDFMNLLSDVAICIEDALKAIPGLISYAGNGNFVVVTSGSHQVDAQMIGDMINVGLEEFAGIYQSDSIPTPLVVVGNQVRKSLFSRVRPAQFLESAIAAIGPRPAPQLPRLIKMS